MNNFRFKTIACILICFSILLTGCAGSGLSKSFDEKEVKKKTEMVISYINNKDSEAIIEISDGEMKRALTEEILQEIFEDIDEGGKFEKIIEMSVAGKEDKVSKKEFALVVAKAKYEKKELIYTISFNDEMELAGLFYK